MTGAILASLPNGAALWHRLGRTVMDVILHLGAHRTGTTTFQHYMRDQLDDLAGSKVAYWGPQDTRKTIFPGVFRSAAGRQGRKITRRAEGRIRLFAQKAQTREMRRLLISDENILGSCMQSLQSERLYPAAGERTARISAALEGRVRRIVLSVRSQDLWWASACALTVSRGHPVPSLRRRDAISRSRRSWRDVITDLACALPDTEILVMAFEAHMGRPDRVLQAALGSNAPKDDRSRWLNRSQDVQQLREGLVAGGSDPAALPDQTGRWQPFTQEQAARLAENYADDMHWLKAGADGLATLTEEAPPNRADISPPDGAMTKGRGYDEGQLAQNRRS